MCIVIYMNSTATNTADILKSFLADSTDTQLIESIAPLEAIPARDLANAERKAHALAVDELETRHPELRIAANAWYEDMDATGTYADLVGRTL